jgi:hypothetical protein
MNHRPSDEPEDSFYDPIILPESPPSSLPSPSPSPSPFPDEELSTIPFCPPPSFYPHHAATPLDLFQKRIEWMNQTFELEVNEQVTNLGPIRLLKFYKTIIDEVTELLDTLDNTELRDYILENDILLIKNNNDPYYIEQLVSDKNGPEDRYYPDQVDIVALADVLGDLVVYIFSEFIRWGIPTAAILNAIMDSQESKLVNGKPVKSADGAKFVKGPYYEAPETRIEQLLFPFED